MPIVEWSDNFLVGFSKIDRHNKLLFEQINKTFDEFAEGAPVEHVRVSLDELINYIFFHFASEEIWMSRTKYADIMAHEKAHFDFTYEVISLHKRFRHGTITLYEMLSCLLNSMIIHIHTVDVKYASFCEEVESIQTHSNRSVLPRDIANR